ncbi:hypothetical protein K438DRAFT_1765425 [Mycena galopus ATCC 62051]|nr:hypothetical protein K438DRAFT_1765425 [Mycena galopus ATCC 62051]
MNYPPPDSEWCLIESRFEGPGRTKSGRQFVISVVLEPRVEKYFSGIQVVICCREDDPQLEKLVQDTSTDSWRCAKLVLLPSWPIPDGRNRRIAYQFVQLVYDPIVLYLSFNHTLRRSLKPNNKSGLVCSYPASMGIFAFSVRICPWSERRIFTQPPPEILSAIFGCAVEDKMYAPWRPTLISFALVCRDWIVALEHLFHDFGTYTSGKIAPDLEAVSKAVQAKSQLGKAIYRLSHSHFGNVHWQHHDEQEYLVRAIAFKNILHSAKHVRELDIFHTHSSLQEELVEALSQSRDVKTFLINSYLTPEEPKYLCHPTLPELFRCFQKWSRLHGLQLFGWEGPNPFLQTVEQFTDCNLTAGSHSSLSDVNFNAIIGLSNAGLKDWLLQVAPALRQLNIEKCSIAKASDDEEYALDAAMSRLTSISSKYASRERYSFGTSDFAEAQSNRVEWKHDQPR